MTELRSAIVGSGFVARVHAATVRDLGGTVVAVCSRTRAGAELFADEVGDVTAYDSFDDLLRGEAVDVVHVCTPNALHAEQALLALEYGSHVVCEKPLATSTEESGRMLEALNGTDRIGAVAYHVRGYPLVEHMRATVAGGGLGELRVVHGRYVCDDALLVSAGWRLLPESSGPTYVTADLGAHWFDLAEHVTGARISEVLADFRTFVPGRALEDHASLLLRFDNGAAGSAEFSALGPGRKNQLLFELEGSRGGFTRDQEVTERVTPPPRGVTDGDRRQGPRRECGACRTVRALPARARGGVRRCVPRHPGRRLPGNGRRAARLVSDFRRRAPRHAGARGDAAERAGWLLGLLR